MKLKKINGSVTHLVELPDHLARQMLAAHPGVYFVDEPVTKEPEETTAEVTEEKPAKALPKSYKKRGK